MEQRYKYIRYIKLDLILGSDKITKCLQKKLSLSAKRLLAHIAYSCFILTTKTNIKENLLIHLHQLLDEKISFIQKAIESAKESRDSDTKSSAGDKFETNRAMMQIELEKNQQLLAQNLKLKKEISDININKKFDKVEFGSFVLTNQGNYFISIGIGKIETEEHLFYSISMASPIGQILKDKVIGDIIKFQAKNFIIEGII